MKIKFFTVTVLLASFFLFSCQKEIHLDTSGTGGTGTGGNGGTTTGTLLVKIVSKSGTDSTVTVLTYNPNKKIVNEKITGMSQGYDVGNEIKYYRNSTGIITSFTQINAAGIQSGVDSTVTIVHYDAAASKYTSTVAAITAFGFTVYDSVVFIYDASGKIIRDDHYQGSPGLGMPYAISTKTKYVYTGANLTQQLAYIPNATTGADDLETTLNYTYDAKTNPVLLDNEAFVTGTNPERISANNITKVEFINAVTPSTNFTVTGVFTYTSTNRPATAVSTQVPGNTITNSTYYYQ